MRARSTAQGLSEWPSAQKGGGGCLYSDSRTVHVEVSTSRELKMLNGKKALPIVLTATGRLLTVTKSEACSIPTLA